MGLHLEGKDYNPTRNKIHDFESIRAFQIIEIGQWSDDTALALCIADSLIEKNLKLDICDMRHRFTLWWFSGYNNGLKNSTLLKNSVGIGLGTANSILDFIKTGKEKVEP